VSKQLTINGFVQKYGRPQVPASERGGDDMNQNQSFYDGTDQIPSCLAHKMEVGAGSTPSREFVRYALSIGALELVPGGRKLKSERISPYFFNSGLFNTGLSLAKLASAYVSVIRGGYTRSQVIFGPAYKGIPLVSAVATLLGDDTGYAFNRKEEKDHGDGGMLVGASLKGKRVTILDDVMTTGSSIIEAAEIIRAAGGMPVNCVISFDRQERASGELSAVQEFEQKYKIPVLAAATLTDLISVLEHTSAESGDDNIGEFLEEILAYKAQYGVGE